MELPGICNPCSPVLCVVDRGNSSLKRDWTRYQASRLLLQSKSRGTGRTLDKGEERGREVSQRTHVR